MTLSRIPGVAVGVSLIPIARPIIPVETSSKRSSAESAESIDKNSPGASSSGTGKISPEVDLAPNSPGSSILAPGVPQEDVPTHTSTTPDDTTDNMKFKKFIKSKAKKGKKGSGDAAKDPQVEGSSPAQLDGENVAAYQAYENGVQNIANTDSSGIPEPTGPETCFPGYGDLPNITGEANVWYRKVRVMLDYGIKDMDFADGKYKDVITSTYPLRDSLNKIMWDKCLTPPEGATLVRFGRIYARAQGDAADGHVINDQYISTTGLDGLTDCLAEIFKAETARRKEITKKKLAHLTPSDMEAVYDCIGRLELVVAENKKAADAAKAAEAAKAEAKAEKAKDKGNDKGKGKGKAT